MNPQSAPEGWPPPGSRPANPVRPRMIVGAGVAILLVVLFFNCFYSVAADSKGVVLRFGSWVATTDPGLHGKWPWPIEEVLIVPVESVQVAEFGFQTVRPGRRSEYKVVGSDMNVARMLTGDLNLAHVEWVVQYQISDPRYYLFNIGGSSIGEDAGVDLVDDVAEAVMRRLVGDRTIDEVISSGRAEINSLAQTEMQAVLDHYQAGIRVISVRLQSPSPPEQVKDSFNAVNRAQQEKERIINDARGERNLLVPAERGKRDRAIAEAEGYAERIVQEARGEANAFLSQLLEYQKSPEVTRQRLYLECMEEVLLGIDETIIVDDSLQGILPLLQIDGGSAATSNRRGGGQ